MSTPVDGSTPTYKKSPGLAHPVTAENKTPPKILYERHVIRNKNGTRRTVYRRATTDEGATSTRARDGAPSPTLTAGESFVLGGSGNREIPYARRVVNSTRDFSRTRGARYTSWFRAQGTMGSTMTDETYARMQRMLEEDLEEDIAAAPAAFYSNQSGLLGKVRWRGIKILDEILESLNIKLQFRGEEIEGFDFRDIYSRWEYRYQVIETIGQEGTQGGISQVVVEHRAAYPRRSGWSHR